MSGLVGVRVHAQRAVLSCLSVQAELGAGKHWAEERGRERQASWNQRAERGKDRATDRRGNGDQAEREREREEGRDGSESEKRTADGNLVKETATGGLYDIGHSLPTFWACVDTGLSQ